MTSSHRVLLTQSRAMKLTDSDELRHDKKCKKMKLSQDMQLIQKLRDDRKRMKKVFEVVLGSYEQKSNQDQVLDAHSESSSDNPRERKRQTGFRWNMELLDVVVVTKMAIASDVGHDNFRQSNSVGE
ncbi:hypothetical protein Tco_0605682 [Tanacetum coccineum]